MFLFGQLSNSGCHQNMSVPLLDISSLSQCLDLPAAHSETQSLTPWFCSLLSSLFVPFFFLIFIVIPNSVHLSSCMLLVLSHQALSCLVSCPCPVASSPLINLLSSLITLLATQSNLSHCLSCLLPSLATKVRPVSAGEVCAWVYGARALSGTGWCPVLGRGIRVCPHWSPGCQNLAGMRTGLLAILMQAHLLCRICLGRFCSSTFPQEPTHSPDPTCHCCTLTIALCPHIRSSVPSFPSPKTCSLSYLSQPSLLLSSGLDMRLRRENLGIFSHQGSYLLQFFHGKLP